jgi:hypothetical protein
MAGCGPTEPRRIFFGLGLLLEVLRADLGSIVVAIMAEFHNFHTLGGRQIGEFQGLIRRSARFVKADCTLFIVLSKFVWRRRPVAYGCESPPHDLID